MQPDSASTDTSATTSQMLWFGPYGRVVAGIFALAFLIAFESLAVATVMPLVAADLDGLALFAVSFAAPMAVAVVSMTVAGPMADRHGPGKAMRGGVMVFAVGLVVAGLAPSMVIFLLGRAVQGLGMGFIGVSLYVVIGQVFPDHLRARVFTVMTSAWVLPALVGPLVAGFIADTVGWRWVFLGVPLLAAGSLLLVWDTVGRLRGDELVVVDRRRLWWATLAAVGILAVSAAGQRSFVGWQVLLVIGLVTTIHFAPRLLPVGTWRGGRGLPSVLATRSTLGAAYFGAETYVPLSLVEHRGLSATSAGLFLTTAAVMWFAGSWAAAHVPALESKSLRVKIGAACVLVGVAAGFLTLATAVPLVVVAVAWSVGGLGMGLATPTLGVLLLDHSAPAEQGVNSGAMQTSDSIVQALVLAIGSVVFAIMLDIDEVAGYVLVFGLATVVAVIAAVLTTRLTTRPDAAS